jgi:hypothetical protein
MEKLYTSDDLAKEYGCARITVLKWANKNNIRYIGEGMRKIYTFTEEDKKRFTPNKKAGRPKKD